MCEGLVVHHLGNSINARNPVIPPESWCLDAMFLGSSHTKPREMALMSKAKKPDFIGNMPLTSSHSF